MSDESPAVIPYGTNPATSTIVEKGVPTNPLSVDTQPTSSGGFYPAHADA